MTAPGIDVIIPCHNYGRYLRQCVSGVLAETGFPVRILIIDDASTDGSGEVAMDIAARDPRVEVVRHATNRGHIATFNEGLSWVRAKYLLLLSADDLVAPGALARAVTLMEAHENLALVYGRAIRFTGEDAPAFAPTTAASAKISGGLDFIQALCATPVNPVETATAVVRASVQRQVGAYSAALPHSGDLDMWLRCALHGDVGVMDEVQAFVRFHGANMRDGYIGAADYRERHRTFRHYFERHCADLPHAPALKRQVMRSLARELLQAASNALDHGRPTGWLVHLAREFQPGVTATWPFWRLMMKRTAVAALRGTPTPSEPDTPSEPTGPTPPAPAPPPRDMLISLVICTRDRASFLPPCLESLGQLTSAYPWEMILVDNGSRDDTWNILAAFAKAQGPRVTLISEPHAGLSHARNTGVRAARGRLICFTDDDCYPQPGYLDAIAKAFEDPDLGFLGGRIVLHDPDDAPVSITVRTEPAPFPSGSFIPTGEIQGASMAFRREVFDRVGLFDTAFGAGGPLKGAEDCEMVVRASFAGWNGGFFPEPLIYHHHRRRADGAAQITSMYDYSRGAFFAKLLMKYPAHRRQLLRQWYWATPILWRPTRRTATKFWREFRGACRYAFCHSSSRLPRLAPSASG